MAPKLTSFRVHAADEEKKGGKKTKKTNRYMKFLKEGLNNRDERFN